MEGKKVLYSAAQTTGCMTIGNYIGAIKNWVKMQEDFNSIFCVADLHSLTVRQEPAEFRARAMSFFAQFLALGLDPKKSVVYMQSHVAAHAELTWLLNCFTYVGELQRMTQFKDKSAKHEDNINAGLLTYPVLMAADILLYQTSLVPIGIDQKQHLEIARDIAIRFNNRFGETFVVPEAYIPAKGAKIYSLQNPEAKMSKSDEDVNATISILDEPDVIVRKFKRAVTDSDTRVCASDEKPGITNLMTIYSAMTGKTMDEITLEFDGKGYGDFKLAVADSVISALSPVQAEYKKLMADKAYLVEVMKNGAEAASYLAEKTLRKVKKKVGLTEKPFR